MFATIVQFQQLTTSKLSEYLGSVGVEGGQGDNDYNYGKDRS